MPRIGEERAGERDELTLAEREPEAALADLRVVARPASSATNASAPTAAAAASISAREAVGPAEGDVVGDGPGEEEALLRDDAELACAATPA